MSDFLRPIDKRCSAINKTTGTRCKSTTANAYGTCRRHPPAAPSDAEFAAAVAVLNGLPPLQPRPSLDGIKDMTVEQLEELWQATLACKVYYPEHMHHFYLYKLSDYLGIQNEFVTRVREILAHNDRAADDAMMIHDVQADKRRWVEAMETPLAGTREGLEEQMRLVEDLYHYVEAADAGAGYQMWQVVLFEQLRGRMAAIKSAADALDG